MDEQDKMPGAKKVFVKTYGCQMNVYDSERIVEALQPLGFAEVGAIEEADLVVLNTCHIREKAAEKVYSELGRIGQLKAEKREQGRDLTIAVAGCVAQAEGQEIVRRAPVVDIVVGPQNYHRLPEYVFETQRESRKVVRAEFPVEDKFNHLPKRRGTGSVSAFLTVQEGCDKFCTFCVVPYTRGAEFSRPVADLIEEARTLIDRGVRELTLLGQNVNAYHGDNGSGGTATLADLIHALADLEGLERLRYTTSHPRDMTPDLIDAHRSVAKLMPYLHLPFQSGSDRILAAMNRKHTAAFYIDLIERLRAARPDLALSTDIIVGFPGEREADFEATLALVERIGFAQAYSFKYSPRPGTPAAALGEQVSDELKSERLHRLQAVLMRQQASFNSDCVGKTMPVLFDRRGRHEGQLVGRSPYLQSVHAHAETALLGAICPVEIQSAGPNSLAGVVHAPDR
ncbi:MAG: tRNA (N6-isopentenyl adenosine(37)-C2)-methylthiotransferase MiaB [Hyphomicrobiaceae bacterium]